MKEFPAVPPGRPIFIVLTVIAFFVLICAALDGLIDKKVRESYREGNAAGVATQMLNEPKEEHRR